MSSSGRRTRLEKLLLFIILLLLLLIIGFICKCPCRKASAPCAGCKKDTIYWGNYNILFNKSSNAGGRQTAVKRLQDSLTHYLVSNGVDTSVEHVQFAANFCPCDSFLVNVDVTLIDESGNPLTPTRPSPPVEGGGLGGDVFASTVNQPMFIPEYVGQGQKLSRTGKRDGNYPGKTIFTQPPASGDPILAIIDTGLDSLAFFQPGRSFISSRVWRDPSGTTLFNTLAGAQSDKLIDDEQVFKHGTSVTYVALAAARNTPLWIMPIKALDADGKGSSFSVACAMSYALQRRASVINVSLGYKGEEDPIFKHYFELAESMHVPVVAAAGNDPTHPHQSDMICSDIINHADSMAPGNIFYPAAFGERMDYVISVTGVNRDSLPCHYQYFSPNFVYVGVMNGSGGGNGDTCCAYLIPFLKDPGNNDPQFVEGTSFAAPVASGRLIAAMRSDHTPPKQVIDHMSAKSERLKPFVESGRMIKN